MKSKLLCLLSWSGVIGLEVFEGAFIGHDAHFRFGAALGERFAEKVKIRAETIMNTSQVPEAWLLRHEKKWPQYIDELRGIAFGSKVPFDLVLALNFNEELSVLEDRANDHCSDAILPKLGLLAHNEDGGSASDKNATFLVNATVGTAHFFAYTYAGELCSGAFAWTSNFGYTLNYVQPALLDQDSGYGRSFVSRALLDCNSFSRALQTATQTTMIAGHNYQFISFEDSRFYNIEAAASSSAINPLDSHTFFFHANQYDSLSINQSISDSSIHRTVRAMAQLGPRVKHKYHLLNLLSDTHDIDGSGLFPLYRPTTLATVCFDLPNASISIFENGPACCGALPAFQTTLTL